YLPEKVDEELLRQLRSRDVPFNISDHRGRTALMVYVDRYDDPATVGALLKNGVRINARAHSGETAFETAIRRRHIFSAEKLFLSGARYDSAVIKKISPEYRLSQWVRLGADKVKKQLAK
ncbi:MAG: hypothetical protein J6Q80_00350, partial [Lentisphaeria bacterium]|nr:hypothetical protein [Lentisphaeria bacterium]